MKTIPIRRHFAGFHPQPLLLTQTLPCSPPSPTPPLSPAGPSRPTLVPGTFFGSILLHGPLSAWRARVDRNTSRGRGARPPRRGQGCCPQPASRSSCCSPCSSPAPTVLPAHTVRAWLNMAREGVPSSGYGPYGPSPQASLGPWEQAGLVRPGWRSHCWQQLSGVGCFTGLFHTWCHAAGTLALKNRCLFVRGFVSSVPISGVPG